MNILLILYARIYRWLFWSKENRERLDNLLRAMDKDLSALDEIIEAEGSHE